MKRWQLWIGLAISALFLFLAVRDVDLATAWGYVRTAEWRYLVAGWFCLLLSYVLRIWRWRAIVQAIGPVPFSTLGQVYMVGFMANNVLPARIGEVVRAYLLGQASQVSAASALGTIAVERVFDVIVALLFLILGTTLGSPADIRGSVWVGGVLVAGLVAFLVALALWGEQLSDRGASVVARFRPEWGRRVGSLGRSFVLGLRAVGTPGRAARTMFWSLGVWGLFVAYAALVMRAYGLRTTLFGALFLLGMGGLGVSIPSAPGNVGTLEGAYVLALQLLSVGDPSSRVSFALTYHVVEWVTTGAIGLLCLGSLGLSFRQISRIAQQGGAGGLG
ncbi:MAG: flippase-like domain-containing protein [Anaerolineae bacterium]|nr:flippase-like domain-containing protein [Anaerolineae bacterium]